jgi:hypothetical protein
MDDTLVQKMEAYVAQLEADAAQLKDQRGSARKILVIGLLLSPLGFFYHWAAVIAAVLLTFTIWGVWLYIGFTHAIETRERLEVARAKLAAMR